MSMMGKPLSLSFVFALVSLLAVASRAAAEDRGCIATVDPNVDYFPDKAQPLKAQGFDISYHKTYKIVTNKFTNSSFLLYQCGSEPPLDQIDGGHDEVIEIPVTEVGVEQTVTIPFLDTLGELNEIVLFMTDIMYVSSPCFLDRINAGQVVVAASPEEQLALLEEAKNDGKDTALDNMVAFVGPFSDTPFEHPVPVSEYLEKTNGAIYEWLLFYAAFFNQEAIANEAVAAAADRYECVTENAARIEADLFPEKPVVLWGSYSSYCGGWNFAKCPNFYCEIANACSAEILHDEPDGGSLNLCGGYIFKSLDEFVEFGKNADFWVYDSSNWEETYQEFGAELDKIKAVQNKQVFDNLGAGPNKWYEERFASYYDLVQDFCSIVGTTRELPIPGWFRNVYTEPIGDAGTCTAVGGHSILPYNFDCEPSQFDPVSFGSKGQSSVTKAALSLLAASLAFVAALII